MNYATRIGFTLALPVFLGGIAFAAAPPDPVQPAQPALAPVKTENLATTTLRAGKLIGTVVMTRDDKTIGDIKEIVLDRDLRKAGYAVVSCNDIGGMNDKLAGMPLQAIHFDIADKGSARLSLGEMQVRTAPTFAKSEWPVATASAAYYGKVDEYYAKALETAKAEPGAVPTMEPDRAIPAAAKLGGTTDVWTRRATELIGRGVQNSKGEGLGELKDIVIDWNSGDIRYAVLAFGGTLGIGDRLYAVPINQFQTQPGEKFLVLNADKEQLKQAPGFDKDHWPDFTDANWQQSVDRFYSKPAPATPAPAAPAPRY